jgi:hypothetical protein
MENGFPVISWHVPAAVLNGPGVSYRVTLPPGTSAQPCGFLNGCELILGTVEVKGAWPHTGKIGGFEDAHDIGSAADLAGGPGALAADPGDDATPGTDDDVYTVHGSGAGIGDAGDSFHFTYRRVRGDFEATVRITDLEPPSAGKGPYGLMVRADCAPDAKYSLVHANLEAAPAEGTEPAPGEGVFYQFRRTNRNAAPNAVTGFAFPDPDGDGPLLANQPGYFRLLRRGPTFTGYASFDGVDWKLIGSDTWYALGPKAELLVGFACSRGGAAEAGAIGFTDFRIRPPPSPEVFFNQSFSEGSSVYASSFDDVPDGELPRGLTANCAGNCDGFKPAVVGGRLRLTQEGVEGQATSVFIDSVPLPVGTGAVVIEFTAYFSHSGLTHQPPEGNPDPGEGLTMTFLAGTDGRRVGDPGGGLGYQGITGSFLDAVPSFSIEADSYSAVYFNEGTGSPSNDGAWHLGINAGGNMNCVALNRASLPDIFGKGGVRFRVEYTSDGKVAVSVGPGGGGAGGAVERPTLAAQAQLDPLGSGPRAMGIVGFTGGTSTSTQTSEVDDVDVKVIECTDSNEHAAVTGQLLAAPGSLVVLDAGESDAGDGSGIQNLTFAWSVSGDATIEGPADGPTVTLRMASPVGDGEAIGRVAVDDQRCAASPSSSIAEHRITVTDKPSNWMSYDANNDGLFNIADPLFHLNALFAGRTPPECAEAMDFNGDATDNIADAIGALNYLFLSGSPPVRGDGCALFLHCRLGGNCP